MVWLYNRMTAVRIVNLLCPFTILRDFFILFYFLFFPASIQLAHFPLSVAPSNLSHHRPEGRRRVKIPHISPDRWRLKFYLLLSSPVAAMGRELSPLTLPALMLLLTFLFLSLEIKGNGGGGQEACGGWGGKQTNRYRRETSAVTDE